MRTKAITSLFLFSFIFLVGCKDTCSNKDWCQLRSKNLNKDVACIYAGVILPEHPLTLDDTIEIALKQNLSLLAKQQEYCIQKEVATREKLNMLPKLIANWENNGRTENTGSFSQSLVPGVPPAPLSISSEQYTQRYDVGFVFNLVDFGIAFFRSRQECGKVLIAQLEYERLRQTLVVNLTRQFWKASVAKMALQKSIAVVEKALEQQEALQRQMDAKVISEIQGLRNENQLINIRGQLQAYSAEYHNAIAELGLLMGIPGSISFELADIDLMSVDLELCNVTDLEHFALVNRPELYSSDVEEMIRVEEARQATVQMLPGVELFGGPYHDSNKFLLHNNWLSAGLRATWNLLNIPAYYKEKQIALDRKTLVRLNRLALSVGVISQVHLSYYLYMDNLESYMIAKELESVNKRLLLAAKNEQRQGNLHEADILKFESEALFSEIDAATKYAELQDSLEQLNSSIGSPRYFKTNMSYVENNECSNYNFSAIDEEDNDFEWDQESEVDQDYDY